jgi:sirohydrochlorin ferrochelatase
MPRTLVIVGHGQPSDPAPAEEDLARVAGRTATLLPGWDVRSATMADEGRLGAVTAGVPSPVVFPFFMADGWFTRTLLPRRLAEVGAPDARILAPFGILPAAHALAVRAAREGAADRGWAEGETALVLAAHGSGVSRAPAEAAAAMMAAIRAATAFPDTRLGFIEEPPLVAETLRGLGPRALLLPLFIARWGHVEDDIPAAVAEAGFDGVVLPPLGTHPDAPAVVAAAVLAAAAPSTA